MPEVLISPNRHAQTWRAHSEHTCHSTNAKTATKSAGMQVNNAGWTEVTTFESMVSMSTSWVFRVSPMASPIPFRVERPFSMLSRCRSCFFLATCQSCTSGHQPSHAVQVLLEKVACRRAIQDLTPIGLTCKSSKLANEGSRATALANIAQLMQHALPPKATRLWSKHAAGVTYICKCLALSRMLVVARIVHCSCIRP